MVPLLAQPGLLTAGLTDPELGPLVRAPATMRLLMADPVLAPLLATATNNTTATTATAQPERGRLIVSPSRGQGNEDRLHAAGLNAHEELIALASHHPSAVGGGDAVPRRTFRGAQELDSRQLRARKLGPACGRGTPGAVRCTLARDQGGA